MARRWTEKEKLFFKRELTNLYVNQNKTINEVGAILKISPKTVFQRLKNLNIKTQPYLKPKYLNKRYVHIPHKYNSELAEFFGIMLGDGNLSHFQVIVTLGNKEDKYAMHIVNLIENLFEVRPKISIRKKGYKDVYLGSVDLTSWLKKEGLVYNKVESQVDVPKWIYNTREFMESFVRGFFDTDGSIYKLRFGNQISFKNKSVPLLKSLQKILKKLEYSPSKISSDAVYLTRRKDLERFRLEISSNNPSKKKRLKNL